MLYTHNGILLSLAKEGNLSCATNTNGPRGYYDKYGADRERWGLLPTLKYQKQNKWTHELKQTDGR